MPDNGLQATGNKQVIGWVVTAMAAIVVCLFQYAIMDKLSTIDNRTFSMATDVAGLKSDMSNTKTELNEHQGEINDLEKPVRGGGMHNQSYKREPTPELTPGGLTARDP